MKRKIALILVLLLTIPTTVYAAPLSESDIIYESRDEEESAQIESVEYADGVTAEMAQAEYWNTKSVGAKGAVLMSLSQVEEYNQKAIEASGTGVVNLKNIKTFHADNVRNSLARLLVTPPDGNQDGNAMLKKAHLYADGVEIADKQAYFDEMAQALKETGYKGGTTNVQYAVATKRTPLRSLPTTAYIGYSATDADDEAVLSSLNVNEPFVVKQKMEKDGQTFYYGNSNCVTGWVDGADIGICSDYEEWIGAWEVDYDATDFIVVIQDKIVLEKSVYADYSSELKLTLGTVLKEVPADKLPKNIAERGPWNNYVVYIPTRKADGTYEAKMALISENDNVSEGYLPMTKENVLKVAFGCLGNRYGWGGMLDAMDCSAYTRTIYRCFGLIMPRNTSWQPLVPGTAYSIAAMTDEEKLAALRKVPAGALLYFSGHTMMYLGMKGDEPFVISATGSLSDKGESLEDLAVRKMNSVIINSLMVRRGNGTTWLRNLNNIVCVQGIEQYDLGHGETAPASREVYELSLVAGERYNLSNSISVDGKMKYVTSDPAVATVTKGVLVAKNQAGEATITAYKKVGKKNWLRMGKIRVSVSCPKIESKIYMTEGETILLADYISGGDETSIESVSVDKTQLLTVNRDSLSLNGIAKGTAKVKVTFKNGIKKTVQVIVQKR